METAHQLSALGDSLLTTKLSFPYVIIILLPERWAANPAMHRVE
jgi:hypothetical protein